MYEVELKVRADHSAVRDRLTELDAASMGAVRQEDTYYNAPDRDFAQTDEALRVRREQESDTTSVVLTYKGPRVEQDAKTRQEAETEVDDEAELRSILEGLGYEPAAIVEKERERYELDDCVVSLDTVHNLGEFIEVEYHPTDDTAGDPAVTDADIEGATAGAVSTLERLGLDATAHLSTSYLGLLLDEDER